MRQTDQNAPSVALDGRPILGIVNSRRNSRRSSPYTVATSNNQTLQHRRAEDRSARVTERDSHVQGRAISRKRQKALNQAKTPTFRAKSANFSNQ
jgi:hypothetical protein